MGVRENKVERYLTEQVRTKLNGDTRAWKKSNRDGVPDQIVFRLVNHKGVLVPYIDFIEVKTSDGRRSPAQIREAARLAELKVDVSCVYGHSGVDGYITDCVQGNVLKEEYR